MLDVETGRFSNFIVRTVGLVSYCLFLGSCMNG
ncbi:hypothetical protein C770_GR4pC0841 (plasmid) [Sinorhizobium meliloti GR4]|nr:hypothetical protein C770_GR4pC0841 [Sinorhizobium meliloti GR4]